MISRTSIKLKAGFLLFVFSLNTMVSIACAMGVNMGFNTSHHNDKATEPSIHIHSDGNKHEHHSEPIKQQHEEKESQKKDKDDCCNDEVLKFQSLDKTLNQNAKIAVDVPVFVAILSGFFGINILKAVPAAPQKYIVPTSHPPPSDIRIAIQSFQI